MEKSKVEITVKGQTYTIITDDAPEKVLALANGLNTTLDNIMSSGKVTLTQALVLTALDLADKAKTYKTLSDKYKSEIADYLEDAERAMTERDRYKRENEKLRERLDIKQ
ncbi:MAG: cell division protein ZapA [Clostridia bacterium]|nr:cell division protein ZapA [Clostridia bacterium]MBQ9506510.1 cell division protein ZapA [Clostridia bacterium]MBR5422618.1 cell division protein ZapA [Clostridia bacterium]